MQKIELLSPAKDLETGIAAINCGADAVYVGASRFGARESAGNDLSDLEQLIHYAHRFWAKVYVTVNTLLYDSELEDARKLIESLYDIGADAIIIQDVGLLELNLPPIPLFASTQMHNHTPQRVAFLEKAGLQRAILARELNLAQIREIRAKTSIELETFIHGALCVSYSGQCAMSYSLGGRSGNRGQCAQPCRKSYSLQDGNGKNVIQNRYLLSLKDLNLSDHLEALIDAGVCSFKIEGRLKDKAYVMNVVAHYRRILDEILSRKGLKSASSGICTRDFHPDPVKTFNRGFSTYFIKGRGERISSHQTPKATGEPLGKILSKSSISFTLPPEAPALHPGDGICFLDVNGELRGSVVNRVEGKQVFPDKMDSIRPGILLYRNHDHQFFLEVEKSQVKRKIRVELSLKPSGNGWKLTAVDEDGNHAQVETNSAYPIAEKPERAAEMTKRQLMKLGETDFICSVVDLDRELPIFMTTAQINQLRREVIDQLVLARQTARPVQKISISPTSHPFPEKDLDFRGNVLNQAAETFYRRHGVESIEPAAESGLNLRGRIVMTTKYCLRYELGACLKQMGAQKLQEPLTLIDEQGLQFPLEFDCRECVMKVYRESRSQ